MKATWDPWGQRLGDKSLIPSLRWSFYTRVRPPRKPGVVSSQHLGFIILLVPSFFSPPESPCERPLLPGLGRGWLREKGRGLGRKRRDGAFHLNLGHTTPGTDNRDNRAQTTKYNNIFVLWASHGAKSLHGLVIPAPLWNWLCSYSFSYEWGLSG